MKIIHKAKTSEHRLNQKTVCGAVVDYNQTSAIWKNVTCQACLKRRGKLK